MDIVYIFKEDVENDSEDLRYSLRSLKNLSHEKVFLAGDRPSWARNINHLPVAQTKSKGENWSMNLMAVIKSPLVSDDFIMMNDDFFIMKPLSAMPDLNLGLMTDVIAMYKRRYPEGSRYIDDMDRLYNVLINQGYSNPISYELHTPMVLNKQKVIDLYRHMAGSPLIQFRSYYGNYYNLGGQPIEDVKVFLDNRHNSADYLADSERYLSSQDFLSSTGGSFKRGLAGQFVRSQFIEKSQYEMA